MMISAILSVTFIAFSTSAWADRDRGGDTSIGNGGGVWTCREAAPEGTPFHSRELVWIELVDLSEARRENNLTFDRNSTRTEQEWIDHVSAKIRAFSPRFYLEYLSQLERVQRLFSPTYDSEFEQIDRGHAAEWRVASGEWTESRRLGRGPAPGEPESAFHPAVAAVGVGA